MRSILAQKVSPVDLGYKIQQDLRLFFKDYAKDPPLDEYYRSMHNTTWTLHTALRDSIRSHNELT